MIYSLGTKNIIYPKITIRSHPYKGLFLGIDIFDIIKCSSDQDSIQNFIETTVNQMLGTAKKKTKTRIKKQDMKVA